MSDMECPYCGADQKVNYDDEYGKEEGVAHEHQCSECEKTFIFYTTIYFSHSAFKADCLNGGEHDYKMVNKILGKSALMHCSVCGDTRTPTPDEFKANGIDV